jgi:hypothetical protein
MLCVGKFHRTRGARLVDFANGQWKARFMALSSEPTILGSSFLGVTLNGPSWRLRLRFIDGVRPGKNTRTRGNVAAMQHLPI